MACEIYSAVRWALELCYTFRLAPALNESPPGAIDDLG